MSQFPRTTWGRQYGIAAERNREREERGFQRVILRAIAEDTLGQNSPWFGLTQQEYEEQCLDAP